MRRTIALLCVVAFFAGCGSNSGIKVGGTGASTPPSTPPPSQPTQPTQPTSPSQPSSPAPTPVAPNVSIASLSFGTTIVGQASAPQRVTVTPFNSDAISFASSNPIALPIGQPSCAQGAPLCFVEIKFVPTTTGPVSGTITVLDTDGLFSTIAVTGTGVAPMAAPTLSNSVLDFGSVVIGTVPANQKTVSVISQNSDAVSTSVQGNEFSVATNAACGKGESGCQIVVTFDPTTVGDVTGSLVVTDTVNGLSSSIALTGTGTAPPNPMAGLAYYFPLNEGAGGGVHDASGNGNDATISGTGTPAAWDSVAGIQLNGQEISVAKAAGLPSIGLCAYFPATTGYATTSYIYFSSDRALFQNGYNLGTSYGIPSNHWNYAYFPQIGRSNGSASTTSAQGFSGDHCIEAVIGDHTSGTLDRIFVDGIEVEYGTQGISDNTVGGGELENPINLRGQDTTGFRRPVTLYSVWGAKTRDTSDQAATRAKAEISRLSGLGVSFGYPILDATDSSCTIDGTSLDVGVGNFASQAPSDLLALDFPCTIHNFAITKQPEEDMVAAYEDREATVYHPKAARNIAYNGGVTNSLINLQEPPQGALQDLLAWNKKAHDQGFKTIAATMTSRCQTGVGGQSGDALKKQFNALLLANSDQFDWIANPSAFAEIGAEGACNSTTYFGDAATGNGTHFNNAGQQFYVDAERAAFEGVYARPQTIVTSNYVQTASDQLVLINGAGPITIEMMDARIGNFSSKAQVCFQNAGSQMVTLEAIAGELIGGNPTYQLAPGMASCFHSYVDDPAQAGANWRLCCINFSSHKL